MDNIFFTWPAQIAIAFAVDLVVGDPVKFFHPVAWMGVVIEKSEPVLRRLFKNLTAAGIVLALGLVLLVGSLSWLFLCAADAVSPWLGCAARIYLFYTCLSTRSLAVEVRRVLKPLRAGKMEEARHSLSRIVGRDTDALGEKEILRATVETTAESTVDGIVSVLFYSFLGGPVTAMIFKAVSTLDSMVGYNNERYQKFGWASAKWDDVLNWIPSRLGSVLICLASLFIRGSPQRAWLVVMQDARNQPSPNSGYPEAAFAGALNVQLGGENFYQGRSVMKDTLGQALEPLSVEKVQQALRLMFATSLLCLILGLGAWILVRTRI